MPPQLFSRASLGENLMRAYPRIRWYVKRPFWSWKMIEKLAVRVQPLFALWASWHDYTFSALCH
jgi:hypothetical protein